VSVTSPPRSARDEFGSFLNDIASVVSQHLAAVDQAEAQGVAAAIEAFLLDHEKVIWHWPDYASRLTEDVR
jgi:hypothetical protein